MCGGQAAANIAVVPTEYILDQQGAEQAERERLALVERYHDPISVAALARLGVDAGWRCLDVGAGAGSIARWLAGRVLPSGEVLATDLDTRLLEPLRATGVQVQRSDITIAPPALEAFDLVHVRLLLIHLPDRARAAAHLASAARPGGCVMAGDLDFTTLEPIDPWPGWRGVWQSFQLAVEHAGWDVCCGRRLAGLLAASGLEDVCAEATCGDMSGGSVACELMARTLDRLCERLLAMDVPLADVETSMAELRSPARTFIAPTVWSAWGHRPGKRASRVAAATTTRSRRNA
jgi:SAM-dependent methyltransferase